MDETVKTCTACDTEQLLSQFREERRQCKLCEKQKSLNRMRHLRATQPEKMKQYASQYYYINAERIKAHAREYFKTYQPDKARRREIHREWARNHPEQKRLIQRKWAQNNREKLRAKDHRRRARETSGDVYTLEEVRQLISFFENRCAYCNSAPYQHLDHVVPLARGGGNGISNILPACAAHNLQKSDKSLDKFLLETGLDTEDFTRRRASWNKRLGLA